LEQLSHIQTHWIMCLHSMTQSHAFMWPPHPFPGFKPWTCPDTSNQVEICLCMLEIKVMPDRSTFIIVKKK
jgi:hypothetical protein